VGCFGINKYVVGVGKTKASNGAFMGLVTYGKHGGNAGVSCSRRKKRKKQQEERQ